MGLLDDVLDGLPDASDWHGLTLNGVLGGLLSQNATPNTAPVAPMNGAPVRDPTFGERLAAFGQGGAQGGLIGAFGAAMGGVDRQAQTENAIVRSLMDRGMDASSAVSAARDPQIMQAAAPGIYGNQPAIIDGKIFNAYNGKLSGDSSATVSQGENATIRALVDKGVSPDLARSIAQNPNMAQTILPQIFRPRTQVINNMLIDSVTGQTIANLSDTALKGPEIKEFEAPNGMKYQVFWNAKNQRPEVINPAALGVMNQNPGGVIPAGGAAPGGSGAIPVNQPVPSPIGAGMPAGTAVAASPAPQQPPSVAPLQQPPQQSFYQQGAFPADVNIKAAREEAAKKMADEQADLRTRADAAVDFLNKSGHAKEVVNQYGDVIGPYSGHGTGDSESYLPTLQGFRDVMMSATPGVLQRNVSPLDFTTANENRGVIDKELRSLGTTGLRATYGDRVTNLDVSQALKSQANLRSPDKATALAQIESSENNQYQLLQKAVDAGVYDPRTIPAAVIEDGVRRGLLRPKSFGMTPEIAVRQANAAVAAGADPAKVKQQLQTILGNMR